jgi:aryl-alcohol dehydrogenase-like predicted oxidoreductase
MNHRWLGRTGLRVSSIALGSSPFGTRMGATSGVDQKQADRIVGRALEAGVNLFDTADVYSYGEAEQRLGEALGAHRDDVLLSTKCGYRVSESPNHAGSSRTHLVRQVDASLARLGSDYVDILYVHIYDEHTSLDDLMLTIEALVQAGKVRCAGVSNFPAWQVAAASTAAGLLGKPKFAVYQGLWNVLCRDVEDEIVPMCRELGLGFVAWGALAYGMLTGKYRRGEDPPRGSRLRDPGSHESRYLRLDREQVFDVVEDLSSIAGERGATLGQVALAWLLAQPGLAAVLVGARTIEQLDENLGALEVGLSDDDLARIDALSPAAERWPGWQLNDNRGSRISGVAH